MITTTTAAMIVVLMALRSLGLTNDPFLRLKLSKRTTLLDAYMTSPGNPAKKVALRSG